MDDQEHEITDDLSEETAMAVAGELAVIEMEDAEQSDVRPLEAVTVPIAGMLTALFAAEYPRPKGTDGKKDPTSEYLLGVRMTAVGGEVRLIGGNGHWFFVYSIAMKDREPPEWLRAGITVPAELLKERLGLIEKLGGDTAEIAYQIEAPRIIVRDDLDQASFKVSPLQSGYPDIQPAFDKLNFSSRTTTDLESVIYHPTYLKGVSAVAASLGVSVIRVFATGDSIKGAPTLVTFPGRPSATLVLMPQALDEETRALPTRTTVLDKAIAGTVAALRAHRTRWEMKLDKAANERAKKSILAKIEEYTHRINLIIPPAALPAPEPEPEVDSFEEREQVLEHHEPDAPVGDAADPLSFQARIRAQKEKPAEELQAERAKYRAKLKSGKRDAATLRFFSDVNGAVSRDNNGLTLNQLADGLPVEAWFDAGLSPDEAAVRCLDWKPVVLPLDEGPGEEEPIEDAAE
jgi:hypothetical protein